jgi:hypothetical protein
MTPKSKTGLFKENGLWIETRTGQRLNPLDLQVTDICIEDIAKPLSMLCRFVGQCSRFYSVGQHCIHVADMVFSELIDSPAIESANRTALAALLHDAAEAYTNDISRPVKYAVKGFRDIEDALLHKILFRFNCDGVDWKLIKKFDDILLATEAYHLMPSKGNGWYLPEGMIPSDNLPILSMTEVETLYTYRFHHYGGK